ncbi:other/FunK1 protein kinase [Coprinopsis cinerea okayama7|uniref:Other/FunK1 protein kinase n=1 Tax=Coprinopsis cinerea (strain Okayama-7 / 130 / ATCC MYA-4618 / FGSC 9003) TaxID=240176 RepID=A8PDC9_COPC7|nr:other/FunK1 protein kinase [Coprinopsis cinerea okayama7\|eukprot:XP_001840576.2 other/FunK1 protein kinase [Coprinopsis cinerea okayama7\
MKPTDLQCSYEQFARRYLPNPPDSPTFELGGVRGELAQLLDGQREGAEDSELYNVMESTLNSWLKDTGFTIVLSTAGEPDSVWHPKTRINGGLYKIQEAPSKGELPDWDSVQVGVGAISPHRKDFFSDLVPKTQNHPTDSDVPAASQEAFEQAKSYSLIPFILQHRTHHFTVFLFGALARIVRWDRAGFVFTEAFNYLDYPERLCDFLWRYIHLSPTGRGFDSSVQRVLSETPDWDLIQRRADSPRNLEGHDVDEHIRSLFQETIRAGHRYKLHVQGRYFFVGRPHVRSGRTRGYIAIDAADPYGPFVFLKDTWHILRGDLKKEGDVLEELNSADEQPQRGRKYIPSLVCHHDVEGEWQKTDSQDFWYELSRNENAKCPFRPRQHYRLVVKEVGLPISKFRNGREMLTIISHGVAAHGYAHKKGYMHQDISEERHGLLADWELAEKLTDQGPRQPERTGTWQFLAVDILNNPSKPVEVWHEMESWFHLTLWLAVQYLPHNVQNVAVFMSEFFDDAAKPYDGSTHYKCGALKRTSMQTGTICFADGTPFEFGPKDDPFAPYGMNDVLSALAETFSYRYKEIAPRPRRVSKILPAPDLTPEEKEAAKVLDDQVRFEELLLEYINGPGRPENDKTEPQVSLSEREPFPSSYRTRNDKRPRQGT